MRLLTLPLRLPFKLVRGALSLLQGPPTVGPTPTQKPPQPRFRREPSHVSEEPWPGYDRMTGAAIRNRLHAESREAATAVRLYEAANKGRSTVLEAATRELSAPPSG